MRMRVMKTVGVGFAAMLAMSVLGTAPALATVPSVSDEGALTNRTPTGATVHGNVNPNGEETTCHVQYQITRSVPFGPEKTVSCSTQPGSGTSSVPVEATLTGLPWGKVAWHIVATNASGTQSGRTYSFRVCKSTETLYAGKGVEETCETEKEHSAFLAFVNCPFGAPPYNAEYPEGLTACVEGNSTYKEVWPNKKAKEENLSYYEKVGATLGAPSEFTAGKVTVQLKNPITLRGGFEINEEPNEAEGHEYGELLWIGARGAATIEPVAQPGPSLSKSVSTELLSPSEGERYTYYTKDAKENKTYATVELAGPAEQIHLNEEHQLEEEGTAFVFPVKVHLISPFLGPDCYDGSNENPIRVPFTTGQAGSLRGKLGSIDSIADGGILQIYADTLVSDSFEAPGVENCGVEGGADAAVDASLGLPSSTGNSSILNGILRISAAVEIEKGLNGEV